MSYYSTKTPLNKNTAYTYTHDPLYGAVPPAGQYANVTIANGGTATGVSGQVFTTNTTGNPMWTTTATTHPYYAAELGDISGSAKLVLKGKDADIEINGKSLGNAIQAIEEALLIPGRLNRSTELEQEFDELKALGEQYAEMERKYRDQKRVWDILKKQDQ